MLTATQYMGLAAFLLACAMGAHPACAGDKTDEQDSHIWQLMHGAPKIKDQSGNYWKVRGRIFWDGASLDESPVSGSAERYEDSEFRAARIGVEGKYQKFKFKAELDFAGGKTTAKDVNISYKGPVTLTLGQMIAGPSMEELTSSRHISFMERGMITDAVGFDRRLGVKIATSGDKYALSAGVFGNSIDGAVDEKPSNRILAARASFAPVLQKTRIVHVGASVRHTRSARGGPKRSTRWGPHLAKEKIKPSIGDDALLFGLEAASVWGPLHVHGEYLKEEGDIGSVDGGFLQAGYFLTGEVRKYKAGAGKFDRTKPARPLSDGGLGGWEVLARFDALDARKAGDEKVAAYTLGLTWYPESHVRCKVNYTYASADTFDATGVYARMQVDW